MVNAAALQGSGEAEARPPCCRSSCGTLADPGAPLANLELVDFGNVDATPQDRPAKLEMSSSTQISPEKKKKTDYFEWFVWTAATIVVAMLAAHWAGFY
jgi:hypothetical protein